MEEEHNKDNSIEHHIHHHHHHKHEGHHHHSHTNKFEDVQKWIPFF